MSQLCHRSALTPRATCHVHFAPPAGRPRSAPRPVASPAPRPMPALSVRLRPTHRSQISPPPPRGPSVQQETNLGLPKGQRIPPSNSLATSFLGSVQSDHAEQKRHSGLTVAPSTPRGRCPLARSLARAHCELVGSRVMAMTGIERRARGLRIKWQRVELDTTGDGREEF